MFLLKIRTDADFKYIIGYTTVPTATTFDSSRFVVVTENVYTRVKENFLTKRMKFPAQDRRCDYSNLMFDDDIDINDLKNSTIDIYRQRHVDKHFTSDFDIMSVQFTIYNNMFCSKGFYFTHENREELYLDILNTGDPELIGLLEKFLDLFNEYMQYKYQIDEYLDFKSNIKNAETIPDVHRLYEEVAGESLLFAMNSDL